MLCASVSADNGQRVYLIARDEFCSAAVFSRRVASAHGAARSHVRESLSAISPMLHGTYGSLFSTRMQESNLRGYPDTAASGQLDKPADCASDCVSLTVILT